MAAERSTDYMHRGLSGSATLTVGARGCPSLASVTVTGTQESLLLDKVLANYSLHTGTDNISA